MSIHVVIVWEYTLEGLPNLGRLLPTYGTDTTSVQRMRLITHTALPRRESPDRDDVVAVLEEVPVRPITRCRLDVRRLGRPSRRLLLPALPLVLVALHSLDHCSCKLLQLPLYMRVERRGPAASAPRWHLGVRCLQKRRPTRSLQRQCRQLLEQLLVPRTLLRMEAGLPLVRHKNAPRRSTLEWLILPRVP